MAELVEQRPRIVVGQQRRVALGEVADVHHDGPRVAAQLALAADGRTPGARPLRAAREIVADEHRHMRAVPRHLPRPGVGVVERHVERAELQPEQAVRAVEGRGDHRVEREVGLQRRLIEVMLGLAALFGVVAPVPGLQIAVDAIGLHQVLPARAASASALARAGCQTRISRSRTAAGLPAISVSSL